MVETSSEQLALIGFAARLGTSVSREDGIASVGELRSDAELLMCLLAPSSSSSSGNVIGSTFEVVEPLVEEEPNYEHTEQTCKKSGTFSFSCPSLSVDDIPSDLSEPTPSRERLPSDGSEDSVPSLLSQTVPAVALGRPLRVDNKDALRLSAEAMARNIFQTFQKALLWRKKCWIEALAGPLVEEERKLKEAGATEKELKELLETPAAQVIVALNQTEIEVLDARTSFRVLPQAWDKTEGQPAPPPSKKRRVSNDDGDVSEPYTSAHVVSFQAVLNFKSPAGYSEVTLEAPGIIQGDFVKSEDGEVLLSGASVEVDTRVLAAMIERSSRIIARASAEAFMDPEKDIYSEGELSDVTPASPVDDLLAPSKSYSYYSDSEAEEEDFLTPTVVTPRNKSPPHEYSDSDPELVTKTCIPLPDELDSKDYRRSILRMVSPQPRSGSPQESYDDFFNPRTPTKNGHGPSLVSPPAATEFLPVDTKTGPSLPALVEVACAAMHTS
jgi:hypothetical protein